MSTLEVHMDYLMDPWWMIGQVHVIKKCILRVYEPKLHSLTSWGPLVYLLFLNYVWCEEWDDGGSFDSRSCVFIYKLNIINKIVILPKFILWSSYDKKTPHKRGLEPFDRTSDWISHSVISICCVYMLMHMINRVEHISVCDVLPLPLDNLIRMGVCIHLHQ